MAPESLSIRSRSTLAAKEGQKVVEAPEKMQQDNVMSGTTTFKSAASHREEGLVYSKGGRGTLATHSIKVLRQ